MNNSDDICRNRHQGNPESEKAFNRIAGHLPEARRNIFIMIQNAGSHGLTVNEASLLLNTTPNVISGRFSELKRDGLIVKSGKRFTDTGTSAGVYIVKQDEPEVAKEPEPDHHQFYFDTIREACEPNPYHGTGE